MSGRLGTTGTDYVQGPELLEALGLVRAYLYRLVHAVKMGDNVQAYPPPHIIGERSRRELRALTEYSLERAGDCRAMAPHGLKARTELVADALYAMTLGVAILEDLEPYPDVRGDLWELLHSTSTAIERFHRLEAGE